MRHRKNWKSAEDMSVREIIETALNEGPLHYYCDYNSESGELRWDFSGAIYGGSKSDELFIHSIGVAFGRKLDEIINELAGDELDVGDIYYNEKYPGLGFTIIIKERALRHYAIQHEIVEMAQKGFEYRNAEDIYNDAEPYVIEENIDDMIEDLLYELEGRYDEYIKNRDILKKIFKTPLIEIGENEIGDIIKTIRKNETLKNAWSNFGWNHGWFTIDGFESYDMFKEQDHIIAANITILKWHEEKNK